MHDLRTVLNQADAGLGDLHVSHLGFPPFMRPAQHVGRKEIQVAVPIHIRKIQSHGELTGPAHGQRMGLTKIAAAIVQP